MSKTLITCFPGSPIWPVATPKKSAKTTICRISFLAIASTTLVGETWCKNSLSDSPPPDRAEAVSFWGSGRCIAMPGLSRFTSIIPSIRLTRDAQTNQSNVFAPIRPTDLTSPSFATPTTSVKNTSGATIILISLRKTSGNNENGSVIFSIRSGAMFLLSTNPSMIPIISASII